MIIVPAVCSGYFQDQAAEMCKFIVEIGHTLKYDCKATYYLTLYIEVEKSVRILNQS